MYYVKLTKSSLATVNTWFMIDIRNEAFNFKWRNRCCMSLAFQAPTIACLRKVKDKRFFLFPKNNKLIKDEEKKNTIKRKMQEKNRLFSLRKPKVNVYYMRYLYKLEKGVMKYRLTGFVQTSYARTVRLNR